MNPDFEITTTEVTAVNAPGDQFNLPEEVDVGPAATEDQWAKHRSFSCVHCWKAICSWFTSPLGISFLLVLYLTLGAVMFMLLGTYYGQKPRKAVKNEAPPLDSPTPFGAYDPDGRLTETTLATVDRLWSITEDLNILYRDNWTHLAQMEMRHYQEQIVRTLRKAMLDERYSVRQSWTFPCAFLYALTLVTTIGYGYYTPSTLMARCLTISYSLVGIPLFLVYLSIVGERVGRAIVDWGCCLCCCCCCREKNRRLDSPSAMMMMRRHPINSYANYCDVTLPLEPMSTLQRSAVNSNGHAVSIASEAMTYGAADDLPPPPTLDTAASRCRAKVPVFFCLVLFVVYVCLGSGLLALMEDMPLVDGLHLIINLLLTLGFGTLLPGMSGEQSDGVFRNASQISLFVMAFYIISGMTLLASSFNVVLDGAKSAGHVTATANEDRAVSYHAFPSPNQRQLHHSQRLAHYAS